MELTAWESFYVIVGSSAAALTGLQFVVIAVIAGSRARATSGEIAVFGTPTVFHFCIALFVCANLSAPWQSLLAAGIPLIGCGAAGACYAFVVTRRSRRHMSYKPVFTDWIWHVVLPLIAYVALLTAGIMLDRFPAPSLFVIGGTILLLVYIGIHNAWDAVIFITLNSLPPYEKDRDSQ